jgi:hypothetical protein
MPAGLVQRARIVLLADEGLATTAIRRSGAHTLKTPPFGTWRPLRNVPNLFSAFGTDESTAGKEGVALSMG